MLSLLLLLGCTQSTVSITELCDVALDSIEPAKAAPGDAAVITATPLTTDYDTALFVGGVRAQVTAVDREECEECDACREEAACSECGDCDECDVICESDCVETVSFIVPQVAEGAATVQLYNAFGGSSALTLAILASSDTGDTGDTGGDTAGDTATDTATDTGGDTSGDTSGDTAVDTSTDTSTDTSADTGTGTSTDTGADTSADTSAGTDTSR